MLPTVFFCDSAKKNLWFFFLLAFMLMSSPYSLANSWTAEIDRCTSLQAVKDQEAIDLTDRFAVEFAVLDHVQLHIPWFEAQLKAIDRQTEPLRWLRVAWALTMAGKLDENSRKEAQRIALERKLYLEYAGFLEGQFNSLQNLSSNSSEYLAAVQDTITRIESVGNTEARAYTYATVALILLRQRMVDQSLPYIDKAVSLNERSEVRSPLIDYRVMSALGTSFALRNLLKEEQDTNAQISQSLRACGIRGVLAILAYSRSNLLLQYEHPDFQAIDAAIEEAYSLATETRQDLGIGLALYSKSWAERLRLRFELATQAINQALSYFEKSRMSNWVAKGNLRAAQIDLAAGRYTEALSKVEAIRPSFPPENREAHNDLDWIAYQAQRSLGQPEAALASLDRFVSTFRDLAKQREKEEYNKAAASIGLQLEQERSKSLRQELELKATLLEQAEQVKLLAIILGLASLVLILVLVFAIRQMQLVRRRRDQIEMILNSIDEGLLTVMADRKIGLDYSLFTQTLFEETRSLAGEDFLGVLSAKTSLQSEELSMIEQIFSATFGEDSLAWELNACNLPQTFHVTSSSHRIVQARWVPIFDSHNRLSRILVSLRDMTKEKVLENTIGAQEKALCDLPQTLREVVINHHSRARDFLKRISTWLDEARNGRVDLPQLHTFKGLARAFSYRVLSQDIHDLESQIRVGSHDLNGLDVYCRLALSLREYQQCMDTITLQETAGYGLSKNWLGALLELPLSEFRARAGRENLPIRRMTVSDGLHDWSQLDREAIETFFVHGLSNALDHGFLLPRENGHVPAPLEIRMVAEQDHHVVRLELEDNGAGLNNEALRVLAQHRGLPGLQDNELLSLVWEEEVSTATGATMTSGRGMGLAAVKASIVALGGTVCLHPRSEGSGTILRAEWKQEKEPQSSSSDVA
jgi:hypothetical protein